MSNIDTNIDNWSINDIYELFDLTNPTVQQINSASDRLISSSKMSGNDTIANFLYQARDKAIKINLQLEEDPEFENQTAPQLLDWKKSQFLQQTDKIQSNKYTNRNNVVKIFDDSTHFQMKQDKLGINQSYSVPVVQDTINPKQVNVTERIVVIDSQYRQNILPYSACDISSLSFSTNFNIDVSDSLSNVLSIELNSIQIPQTWYNISAALGNNSFLYVDSSGAYVCVIPDGYYNIPIEWVNAYEVNVRSGVSVCFNYDVNTMKITVTLNNPFEPDPSKIIWHSDKILDGYDTHQCNCINSSFINNNLGWALGFRTRNSVTENLETTFTSTQIVAVADATCSLYGSQYLMLCVDDYQHSRLNKGIIGTVDTTTKLDLPSYNDSKNRTRDLSGKCVAIETEPRKLTQAQIYTINTIYQNRLKKKERMVAPITNNVLALIPIPPRQTITIFQSTTNVSSSYSLPVPIVLYGASLNSNTREYFGPVSIDRLGIKLVDDKGNLVDLNGSDWSFTIKVKQLYQY